MQKTSRVLQTLCTAAPLVLLIACAPQEGEEEAQGETAAMEGMMAEEEAPAAEGMPAEAVSVALTARNESGVTGLAEATHGADSVTVRLTLSGIEAGTEYPAHIHEGTCDPGGPVAAPLNSVTTASGTSGTSTTTVALSALPEGSHYVQAHAPDGQPIACGDAPEHEEM